MNFLQPLLLILVLVPFFSATQVDDASCVTCALQVPAGGYECKLENNSTSAQGECPTCPSYDCSVCKECPAESDLSPADGDGNCTLLEGYTTPCGCDISICTGCVSSDVDECESVLLPDESLWPENQNCSVRVPSAGECGCSTVVCKVVQDEANEAELESVYEVKEEEEVQDAKEDTDSYKTQPSTYQVETYKVKKADPAAKVDVQSENKSARNSIDDPENNEPFSSPKEFNSAETVAISLVLASIIVIVVL